MKNRLLVFAILLTIVSCNKQAKDILRPAEEVVNATAQGMNFINENLKKNIPEYVKGKVLFKLKNNASLNRVIFNGRARAKHILTKAMQRDNDNGIYSIHTPVDVIQTVMWLKNQPDVEWAEPDYIQTTQQVTTTTPDDTHYNNGSQWGSAAIKADQMWASGNFGSKQIMVAVVDEGMYSHADYCVNFWNNPHDPIDGIDNDGNGYIDDRYGWNFRDNTPVLYMGDKHATHVAGIIGAKGGNQMGVIGVASNVTLISIKFLLGSGTTEDAIKGMDYVVDLVQRHGLPIKVMNHSWGGSGFSTALLECLQRTEAVGILNVFAAGNAGTNNDLQPFYPANYNIPNKITVGALGPDFKRAPFSCFGPTTVDVFAPGQTIISTWANDNHTSGYAYAGGTSMAAPFVTGLAAAYWGIHADAGYQQVKAAILGSVTVLPALNGLCTTSGLINASSFTGQTEEHQSPVYECPELVIDPNPPTVPQNFDIYDHGFDPTPGPFFGGYIGIRWDPSTDPEGGTVQYIFWRNGNAEWLLGGTQYAVSVGLDTAGGNRGWVHAIDAWGNPSAFSNSDSCFWNGQTPPPPPPPPPVNYTITVNLDAQQTGFNPLQATLSWNVSTNGNISSIRVERKKNNEQTYTILGSPPVTATSFVDNTLPVSGSGQYKYKVTVTLIQGPSGFSEKQIQIKKK